MKRKVLIYDVDVDRLSLVRQVLAKDGFEVITATSGETARQLLTKLEFDYLLIDAKSREVRTIFNTHSNDHSSKS